MKTYVHTQTCTQMFIATLSLIAKKWKLPRCPSTDEWMNTMLFNPYNGILFGDKKEWSTDTYYNMDAPWKHCGKWRKIQKISYYMIPFIWMSRIDKSLEMESRLVFAQSWVWGWKVTANGHEVSFWGDRNVLKVDCCCGRTIL